MTLYIGLLSGTSIDAIDAALVEFTPTGFRLVATHSHALNTRLAQTLRQLARRDTIDIKTLGGADVELGAQFAEAAQTLIADAGKTARDIVAIGSHGQTIHHAPTADNPFTLQIGDPNVIAEQTGITTVADFRRRDIAAGGQGAPLAPAFHAAAFRAVGIERVIVNIGGIANITRLPAQADKAVIGFDCGPGNTLMDTWAMEHLNAPLDLDGAWAAGGEIVEELLCRWLLDPYFQALPPKTTGPEYFSRDWLKPIAGTYAPQDIQRTLCRLTARTIADSIHSGTNTSQEVYVCGGGAHNTLLMSDLADCLNPTPVSSTHLLDLDPDWVEAVAFAWLAKETLEHRTGSLHSVTGAAHATVLGGIYPGMPCHSTGLHHIPGSNNQSSGTE